MKSVVKTSKTIEEALQEALKELDLREDEVEVEIIEEPSKGLFGLIGNKEAKIRVTQIYNPVQMANDFLGKLLDGMGIKANMDIELKDDILFIDVVDILPSDLGILIGKRGNTLDAVQYLTSLYINKSTDKYIKIVLDSEGYRAKREKSLIKLARRMADKALYSKKPVKLEPMNPFERRIIHTAIQVYRGVTTYSEGDEPYRRVVIVAKWQLSCHPDWAE